MSLTALLLWLPATQATTPWGRVARGLTFEEWSGWSVTHDLAACPRTEIDLRAEEAWVIHVRQRDAAALAWRELPLMVGTARGRRARLTLRMQNGDEVRYTLRLTSPSTFEGTALVFSTAREDANVHIPWICEVPVRGEPPVIM